MGLYHGWDDEEDTHADFVRGGVSPEDFDEAPARHKKKRGKAKPRKKRGCPENDYGPHVYVWVPSPSIYTWWEDGPRDEFYKTHGFYRREIQVCCGCEKRNDSRYTEEFQKLIDKYGWYKANYGSY